MTKICLQKIQTNKPIVIKISEDYKYQSKYLVQEISTVENYKNVAVLFRNNSSSITLINEFDKAAIPFYIKDHDNRFFSHWVVQDILNFMRLSFCDRRPDILKKIYTKVNLLISKKQVAEIKELNNNESVFDNLLKLIEVSDYQIRLIEDCKNTFQKMKGNSPLQSIQTIRHQLGYEEKLIKMSDELGFNKDNLIGILYTLERGGLYFRIPG
jgi:DNA helicase-2/ATP-dependent DNA helicase PcrA